MDIRGLGEGLAFTRLLWLLIGSVVLPTMLLSLYGALAIRHHHLLLGASLDREVESRLAWAEQGLRVEVGNAEGKLRKVCGPEGCAANGAGWKNAQFKALSPSAPSSQAGTQTTRWERSAETGAYVGQTLTEPPGLILWELDHELLETWGTAALRQRFRDSSSVRVRWNEESEEHESVFLPQPLAPPFDALQLSLEWSEGAGVQKMNERSSWLAPLGLIALVVLVFTGTFITALAARRTLRLSRLQTDFVSSVSHELRTPLTSIHMFVETLQSGRIQDPRRIDECLELLGSETERLSRRIERMLNWAKMEAEQRVYEREDVGVDLLFLDSLEALKSQRLLDPGEDISISLADPVPLVCVDRDAVVEALLNLLQNAVRYCPPPRTILLSVERKGSMVGLSVEDDGPGISRPHRTRIFDRFYRIDERLSAYDHARNGRGSGLGLAIVQAVAKAHGGRVVLQSEFGHGSRFTLWLPASWH